MARSHINNVIIISIYRAAYQRAPRVTTRHLYRAIASSSCISVAARNNNNNRKRNNKHVAYHLCVALALVMSAK